MSISSGSAQNALRAANEKPSFEPAESSLRTSDGQAGDNPVVWKVHVCPDGYRIVRRAFCGGKPWGLHGQGWGTEKVIWPTWPGQAADEATLYATSASSASPLAGVQAYWSTVGNRLRDSAKWMATVLGAALATVVGASPLAGVREHRPQGIAITLWLLGLFCLGGTLFLVLQVMRPQSVSYTDVQNAGPRRRRLPRGPLYKWQHIVEAEQDLYLPPGITSLTGLRQSMIIEEITLMALADARATAHDQEAGQKLRDAQTARAARLMELRTAAAMIATIGEYYKLRERSTWATYGGVLLGLLGTAAIVAAFAWPPS